METLIALIYYETAKAVLGEPIWDGNCSEKQYIVPDSGVLSEPIWDGNCIGSWSLQDSLSVLGEPIWDKNYYLVSMIKSFK